MLPFHKCCRLGGQGRIYEIKSSITRLPALPAMRGRRGRQRGERGRPNLARLAKLARLARQVGQVSEIRVRAFFGKCLLFAFFILG